MVHLNRLQYFRQKGVELSSERRAGVTRLLHLLGHTALEWLDLSGTGITEAGLVRFQTVLPSCRIDR